MSDVTPNPLVADANKDFVALRSEVLVGVRAAEIKFRQVLNDWAKSTFPDPDHRARLDSFCLEIPREFISALLPFMKTLSDTLDLLDALNAQAVSRGRRRPGMN